MRDIVFGFMLLLLAGLLFVAVVTEVAEWLMILLGVAFLITVLIWMVVIGDKRRRRKKRWVE